MCLIEAAKKKYLRRYNEKTKKKHTILQSVIEYNVTIPYEQDCTAIPCYVNAIITQKVLPTEFVKSFPTEFVKSFPHQLVHIFTDHKSGYVN